MNILDTLLIFKGDAAPALEQMALMREGLGKVSEAHEKTKSSMLGGIVKAGVFAAGAVAVGLLVEGLHSGVEAYSAAELANTRLDTALKNNGTTLAAHRDEVENASASMRGLGYTNADTVNSIESLVTAGVPLADATARQAQIADLARQKNIGLSDATQLVIKATQGNGKATKDLGIILDTTTQSHAKLVSAQTAETKAQTAYTDAVKAHGPTSAAAIKAHDALATAQKKVADITKAQTDVMGPFGEVMDKIDGKVAGQAEAYGHTLPGALSIMKAGWDNIAESIGKKVVPYIERFAGWITDHQAQITDFVTGTLDKMGTAFDMIGTAVGFVSDHFTIIGPILAGVTAAFVALKIAAAIQGLLALVSLGFDAMGLSAAAAAVAEWALTLPFLAIAAVILGVIAIGYLLITHWDDIKRGASAVGAAVKNFFVDAFHKVTEAIGDAIDWVKQHWPLILAILTGPIGLAVYWVATHFQQIKDTITGAITKVIDWVKQELPKIPEQFGFMIGFVIGKVAKFIIDVVQFFIDLPGKIWDEITKVVDKLLEWAGDVHVWIAENVPKIIDAVVSFFRDLPGHIKDAVGALIGKLWEWAGDVHVWIATNVPKMVDAVVGFFAGLPGKIWDAISALGGWLGGKIQGFGKGMLDWLSSLPGDMLKVGTSIVQGIWNGISGAAGWIAGKIKDFAGGLVSGAMKAISGGSPSRLFADTVGSSIGQGIGVGITEAAPAAHGAMTGLLDGLNNRLSGGLQLSGAGGAGGGVNINQTVNLAAGMDPAQIVPQMRTANNDLLAALQQQLVVR